MNSIPRNTPKITIVELCNRADIGVGKDIVMSEYRLILIQYEIIRIRTRLIIERLEDTNKNTCKIINNTLSQWTYKKLHLMSIILFK